MAEPVMQERSASQSDGFASHRNANDPQTAPHAPISPAVDSRPDAAAQRRLSDTMNGSPRVVALQAMSDGLNDGPRVAALQRQAASAPPRHAALSPRQVQAGVGLLSGNTDPAPIQAVGNDKYYDFIGYIGKLSETEHPNVARFRSADYAARSLEESRASDDAPEFDPTIEDDTDFEVVPLLNEIDIDEPKSGKEEDIVVDPSQEWSSDIIIDNNESGGEPDLSWMDDNLERRGRVRNVGAYIVNAILSYNEVDNILEVLNAMIAGLGEKHAGRVAVVLGINAPKAKAFALDVAMKKAEQLIAALDFPVGLVRSTFTGKFPYGAMRNEVLHSPETQGLTSYFTRMHLHPYISFQDFDTGSRRAGSEQGPHVFEAVDEILSGGPRNSELEDYADPIRPLMIAGGYRVGSQDELIEATGKRFKGKPPKYIAPRLEGFSKLIAEDMHIRDQYARMEPMLPYAPEPNLFVDATAAAFPSPLTGTPLEFGPGGAEYTEMSKRLTQYAAEELEAFYAPQVTKTNVKLIEGKLQTDAQNNRHPQRGRSFYTAFEDLTVATDLSRLAYDHAKNKTELQSHANLATLVGRVFDSKPAKEGSSFANMRDDIQNQEDMKAYLNQLYVRQNGQPSEQAVTHFSNSKLIGTKADTFQDKSGSDHRKFSRSLQFPFSQTGPFRASSFGTASSQMPYFTNQIALRNILEERRLEALHQSVQDEAHRIGVDRDFKIGHADGDDNNCTIISIFAAAGVSIDRQTARDYRAELDRLSGIGTAGDIDLTVNVAQQILQFVTQKTGQHYALSTLAEAPRNHLGQTQYAATPLANNGAGHAIYIFFAGTHFSPATRK